MSKSDYAIRVEGLGKQYRLGLEQNGTAYRYKSLRDSLGTLAKRPIHAVKNSIVREPMNETNSFWALKDVSFDVKKGEVVGIIGRNGAGKSTLLKILSRITKPTTGQVDLYGRVGSLLEVGTGFHPELSGRENIYLNGAVLGMGHTEVRNKFDTIVEFSGVEKFIDMAVKQYSSGMYTRLAFAVAAHLNPEILVIDEVLAVGDSAFQKKCLGKMDEVAQSGRTVLFVSHNMGAVRTLCKTVVVLEQGSVYFYGGTVGGIEAYDATNGSNGEADGIISEGMHISGSNNLLFKHVRLLDSQNEPNSLIPFGEPIVIELLFEARQLIQEARLGIAICGPDGRLIGTTHHTDAGQCPLTLNKGVYRARVRIPLHLRPGEYTLNVGAHESLGERTISYVPNSNKFSVTNSGARAASPHYNAGLLELGALWEPTTAMSTEHPFNVSSIKT